MEEDDANVEVFINDETLGEIRVQMPKVGKPEVKVTFGTLNNMQNGN